MNPWGLIVMITIILQSLYCKIDMNILYSVHVYVYVYWTKL